jgi:hypothetical protein
MSTSIASCTAFLGLRRLARGDLQSVALAAHGAQAAGADAPLLVFDDTTAQPVEFDLRGAADAVAQRYAPDPAPTDEADASPLAARSRGRPKLGVVAREVTLLPRHWDWLATQPGGASVALRRLVEVARKAAEAPDRQRRAREVAYRFMTALGGDLPRYEEATRALFAGDAPRFEAALAEWPADVADYARERAAGAFGEVA